jgi:hypothetical protein
MNLEIFLFLRLVLIINFVSGFLIMSDFQAFLVQDR